MKRSVSICVPVYNEESSVEELYKEINSIVKNNFQDWEIIFIDDGSSDDSCKLLKNIASNDSRVILLQLNRNFGKADALNEAFKIIKFPQIVTLDADLQDDPNEIPRLLDKLDEGWDCVSGWKKNRKDPISKTIPSKLFNFILRIFSGLKLHDFNCGIKAYDKCAIQSLDIYGGLHRFIPILLKNNRYKITEKIVNHRNRKYGKTKYGKSRFFHGFFDLLTISFLNKYFNKPMYFFGVIGLLLSTIGIIINIYLTVLWFNGAFIDNRPLFFLGILLIVVGIQSLSIGLLGELIVNSSRKKSNKVKRIIRKV